MVAGASLVLLLMTGINSQGALAAPAGPPMPPPSGPTPDTSLTVHLLNYVAGPLDNPLKGFLDFYDPANDYSTGYPHSMEWSYIGLSQVMTDPTNCGFFDWTALENILKGITSHGNQAAIRFYQTYPNYGSLTNMVPPCLNGKVTMLHDSYWNLDTPDYDSPYMIQALQGFISAFAAKYDGDVRLGFITMGLVGYWGEWHTWPYDGTNGYPNYFPTNTTVNTIIDSYTSAFKKTPLLIRYADLGGGHAGSAPVGYHDDSWAYMEGKPLASITLPQSLGGASYAFLQLELNVGAENKWINQVIGGEARPEIQSYMFNYWPNGFTRKNVSNLLASVELTHITWMMNQKGITGYSSTDANVAAAIHKIGYELHVDNAYFNSPVAPGSSFKVGVQIENRGVARFYYPWIILVGLKNSSGNLVKTWTTTWDITQVQPLKIRAFSDWNVGKDPTYLNFGSPYYYDTTVDSTGVSNGTYTVVMRVVNPLESLNPAAKKLRFANDTQNADGWLALGSIQISNVPTSTPTVQPPTNTPTG